MELKQLATHTFFRNLHLLTFPTIYSLPCVPLKWRTYEFFPEETGGHRRRSEVTLRDCHKIRNYSLLKNTQLLNKTVSRIGREFHLDQCSTFSPGLIPQVICLSTSGNPSLYFKSNSSITMLPLSGQSSGGRLSGIIHSAYMGKTKTVRTTLY